MKNKKTDENKKLEKISTSKKIFKIIGIIVLIIVVMLLAHTIKNYIKITMLQVKHLIRLVIIKIFSLIW